MTLRLLNASFGGVALDLASLDTSGGRSLVVHELSRGDLPVVQDRGRATNRTSCDVLFVARAGLADPLARFEAFRELVEKGEPQIFRHPIDGSYLARVDSFSYQIDADADEVSVRCEFVAVGERTTVKAPSAATIAGAETVAAATAAARTEIAEFGGEAGSLDSADTVSEKWRDAETPSPREVAVELDRAAADLQYDAEQLRLSSRIDRWESYKAFVRVQAALRDAAMVATGSDNVETFDVEVVATAPLRVIVANIYGARLAEERLADVLAINDVATPSAVPAGTVLTMPAARGGGR